MAVSLNNDAIISLLTSVVKGTTINSNGEESEGVIEYTSVDDALSTLFPQQQVVGGEGGTELDAFIDSIVDTLWLLDMSIDDDTPTASIGDVISSQKKRLYNLVAGLLSHLPQQPLLTRLELSTLSHPQTGPLISDAHTFTRRLVKMNTSILYRQQKYNLLREEPEGYAKLITFYSQIDCSAEDAAFESVLSLIGFFNLDPYRALDILLDEYIQRLYLARTSNAALTHEKFIALIKKFKYPATTLSTILCHHKLAHIHADKKGVEIIEDALCLLATLITHGLASFPICMGWVIDADGGGDTLFATIREYIEGALWKEAQPQFSKKTLEIGVSDFVVMAAPKPLVARLIVALANAGALSLAYSVIQHTNALLECRGGEESAAVSLQRLPSVGTIILSHQLLPIVSAFKAKTTPAPTIEERSLFVDDVVNVLQIAGEFLHCFCGVDGCLDDLCVCLSMCLLHREGDGDGGGPSIVSRVFYILRTWIFPAIAINPPSTRHQKHALWSLLSPFSPHTRHTHLYTAASDAGDHQTRLAISQTIKQTKRTLQRLTTPTIAQHQPFFSRVCSGGRGCAVVMGLVMEHVCSYDNFIVPCAGVLAGVRDDCGEIGEDDFCKDSGCLASDMITCAILNTLGTVKSAKSRLKTDGYNQSQWLLNISEFVGLLSAPQRPQAGHPPNNANSSSSNSNHSQAIINVIPIINHVITQLQQHGNAHDLQILSKIIQSSLGIKFDPHLGDHDVLVAASTSGHLSLDSLDFTLPRLLEDNGLLYSLWRLLAQQPKSILSTCDSGQLDSMHIKLQCTLLDQCIAVFMQFTRMLTLYTKKTNNSSITELIESVPVLMQAWGIDEALAWAMHRAVGVKEVDGHVDDLICLFWKCELYELIKEDFVMVICDHIKRLSSTHNFLADAGVKRRLYDCIVARCRLCASDAIYCAKFVSHLPHSIQKDIQEMIVEQLESLLCVCTENEGHSFARFMSWMMKEASFVDGDGAFIARVLRRVVGALASPFYLALKNSLILLVTLDLPSLLAPRQEEESNDKLLIQQELECLGTIIGAIVRGDERDDIKMMATRCHPLIKHCLSMLVAADDNASNNGNHKLADGGVADLESGEIAIPAPTLSSKNRSENVFLSNESEDATENDIEKKWKKNNEINQARPLARARDYNFKSKSRIGGNVYDTAAATTSARKRSPSIASQHSPSYSKRAALTTNLPRPDRNHSRTNSASSSQHRSDQHYKSHHANQRERNTHNNSRDIDFGYRHDKGSKSHQPQDKQQNKSADDVHKQHEEKDNDSKRMNRDRLVSMSHQKFHTGHHKISQPQKSDHLGQETERVRDTRKASTAETGKLPLSTTSPNSSNSLHSRRDGYKSRSSNDPADGNRDRRRQHRR